MFGFNTGDLEEIVKREEQRAQHEQRLREREKFEAELEEKKRKLNVLTLSSQRRGRWRIISRGSVSAARITRSAMPRLRALVVSLAPFFNYII